jgi:hypothetical protein
MEGAFSALGCGCERDLHVDFHTGPGKHGHYQLLQNCPMNAASHGRLIRCFGAEALAGTSAPSSGYSTHGSLGQWCAAQLPGRDYSYLAAEFGTYAVLRVLAGLRAENPAHYWAPGGDTAFERAKRELVECFCPRDPRWRRRVSGEALRLVERVITGWVGV